MKLVRVHVHVSFLWSPYHDGLLDLVSIAGINYVFCMVYLMQQVRLWLIEQLSSNTHTQVGG